MNFSHLRTMALAVAVLCVTLISPESASGQAYRMSVEQLKDASDSIVLAKTVSSESYWNDDRSAILTRVILEVEESLSGSSPRQTVVIVPGGQVGKFVHEVSDMPVFVEDEESIVFVERHKSGVNVVAGGALGKLTIERDPITLVRSVTGSSFFLLEDATLESKEIGGPVAEKTISLEEFKSKLRQR